MAEKSGPPPAYPPPTAYPPMGQPGYAQGPPPGQPTVTVVQGQPQTKVVTKQKKGFFGQLTDDLNKLGKTIGKEVDKVSDEVNKSFAQQATGDVLKCFQTGNIVNLVSRSSGRALQIVQGSSGLVVDGVGAIGAYNAGWTVVNEGKNQVRLHNNNNYLAIVNGATIVIPVPPPQVPTSIETRFQLYQSGQFVYIESMNEGKRHVGVLTTGALKPALACGKESDSQWGVSLMYSPYTTTAPTGAGAHKH